MKLTKLKAYGLPSCSAIFLLAGGISFCCNAQDLDDLSIEDLFDVKVMELASGVEQQVNRAPSVVSVITAEEMRAYGATDVHEVLQMVPGLHVLPSSFSQMWPVASFRGIYTNNNSQVLWLVDGRRISYSINGGLDFNFTVRPGNIKRIEVIRGPASALYGAEAYAGVINLVTYDSEDEGASTVTAGSFDQIGGMVRDSVALSEYWNMTWYGEYYTRNKDTDRILDTDAQSLFDSLFGTNASLAPGPIDDATTQKNLSVKLEHEHWDIAARHFYIETADNNGVGNVLVQQSDRVQTVNMYSFEYDTKNLFSDWQLVPSVNLFKSVNETSFQIFPDNTVLPIGSDGNVDFVNTVSLVSFPDGLIGNPGGSTRVYEFEVPIYQLSVPNHQLRYSFGYRYEKLVSNETKNFGPGIIDGTQLVVDDSFVTDVTGTEFIFLENDDRRVWHASVQDVFKINEDIEATIGFRYDDYSDVGSTFTPRATIVWENNDYLTTRFLYGSAFRVPSFAELGIRNNPASIGNPDLDSETLDSYEISLSYIVNRDVWLNLNTYYYKAKGVINYVPDPEQTVTSVAQNINELEGKGVEAEVLWQVSDKIKIDFHYAWQSTENEIAGQQQPFVPGQQLFLRANWQINDNWQFTWSTNGILDRERELADMRSQIDDYWLTNINLQYQHHNWLLSASLKNVFDDDIREPSSLDTAINGDFPLHKRNGIVEMTYRF